MSWNEPLSAMDMEPIAAELTRLRRERDQLREALADLVRQHEEWNEAVISIVGRPPAWDDRYLRKARRALDATTPEEAPE